MVYDAHFPERHGLSQAPTSQHQQNITFPAATNPFAVRNRLLSALSGTLARRDIGASPGPPARRPKPHIVVNLMFTLTTD